MQKLDAGSSGKQIRTMGRGQVKRSLLRSFGSKEIIFKLYVKQSVPPAVMLGPASAQA